MKVSDNGRYLVDDKGNPFFYLADTTWGLFYRITREEAALYLQDRADKGFSAVMPVLVWRFNTDKEKNAYGHTIFKDHDPTKPNEDFFAHVDWVINKAEELGLWVSLLPTWGNHVGPKDSHQGPYLFSQQTAKSYGRFLGERYRKSKVIWIIGGDHNPDNEPTLACWRSMVDGIKEGDGGAHLMGYHPRGGARSSKWVHNEPWLDFNMMQTSTRYAPDSYNWILGDYNLEPAKPTVDGETRYENSHKFFGSRPPEGERMLPYHVRQVAYFAMLSGAMGHTYGCRDLWSFCVPQTEPPDNDADTHWKQALHFSGAYQMGYMKKLFTEYPWFKLVPDQQRQVATQNFGATGHTAAAMAEDCSFALVYVPEGQRFEVNLGSLKEKRVECKWFNPRNGTYQYIDNFLAEGRKTFTPPIMDPDWVLVMEAKK